MSTSLPLRLTPGRFVYVLFDEAGEPWHELILGEWIEGYTYLVRSPDGDEWAQDLGLSDDIAGLRIGTKRWVLPDGLGARNNQPVYRFASQPLAA